MYAVIATPKPNAPVAAWLMDWIAYGPFESRADADEAWNEKRHASHEAWHWRVVKLVPSTKGERQ